jgi:hypothetical protein
LYASRECLKGEIRLLLGVKNTEPGCAQEILPHYLVDELDYGRPRRSRSAYLEEAL